MRNGLHPLIEIENRSRYIEDRKTQFCINVLQNLIGLFQFPRTVMVGKITVDQIIARRQIIKISLQWRHLKVGLYIII